MHLDVFGCIRTLLEKNFSFSKFLRDSRSEYIHLERDTTLVAHLGVEDDLRERYWSIPRHTMAFMCAAGSILCDGHLFAYSEMAAAG